MSIDTRKGNTPAWVGSFLIIQICALWVVLYSHKVSIAKMEHDVTNLIKEVRADAIRRLEWEFLEHEMEAAK